MANRLSNFIRTSGASLLEMVLGLFESRATVIGLFTALSIGVVLGVVFSFRDLTETCQKSPRWLLVNVDSTIVVSKPNDSFLDNLLNSMFGEARQDLQGELGSRMLNTCRIAEIREGWYNEQEYTLIHMLPGPNVKYHELTVKESIQEICAVLDCGDATASKLTQMTEGDYQRESIGDKGEGIQYKDRDVLVSLYGATGGASWTNAINWESSLPTRDWYGVHSLPGESGNVTALLLRDNKLSGAIPAELGRLTSMISLELEGNELTGSIPPEIGNLVNLKVLNVSGNRLTGSIPADLGKLTNLELLLLKGNELTGPIPVELGTLTRVNNLLIDADTGLCLARGFPLKSPFGILAQKQDVVVCRDR